VQKRPKLQVLDAPLVSARLAKNPISLIAQKTPADVVAIAPRQRYGGPGSPNGVLMDISLKLLKDDVAVVLGVGRISGRR
jgi:hypothetical protein